MSAPRIEWRVQIIANWSGYDMTAYMGGDQNDAHAVFDALCDLRTVMQGIETSVYQGAKPPSVLVRRLWSAVASDGRATQVQTDDITDVYLRAYESRRRVA